MLLVVDFHTVVGLILKVSEYVVFNRLVVGSKVLVYWSGWYWRYHSPLCTLEQRACRRVEKVSTRHLPFANVTCTAVAVRESFSATTRVLLDWTMETQSNFGGPP